MVNFSSHCCTHVTLPVRVVSGTGGCELSAPYGVAFDGAGHLGVVEHSNCRMQVLNYADGSHVRTIGSNGSGN